jgi:hypothetical protein
MVWVTLIAVFTYAASRDSNVITYLFLLSERLRSLLLKVKYYLTQNPDHFWVRWRISKNADKDARKLSKELGLDKNKDWYDDNSN